MHVFARCMMHANSSCLLAHGHSLAAHQPVRSCSRDLSTAAYSCCCVLQCAPTPACQLCLQTRPRGQAAAMALAWVLLVPPSAPLGFQAARQQFVAAMARSSQQSTALAPRHRPQVRPEQLRPCTVTCALTDLPQQALVSSHKQQQLSLRQCCSTPHLLCKLLQACHLNDESHSQHSWQD